MDIYEIILIIIWAAVLAYIFQRRCLHKTYTLILGKDDEGKSEGEGEGK